MTKSELIARLAERNPHLYQRDVERIVTTIFDEIAGALAREKATSIAARYAGRIVLGADQTLSLDSALLHKAATMEEARRQLLSMCGRMHRLNSAIAVVKDKEILFETVVTAKISVRDFSEQFLDDYLAAAGESVLSSVGCYQVEGHGVHLFDAIEGDQFTIMGLPILPLLNYFRETGYIRT